MCWLTRQADQYFNPHAGVLARIVSGSDFPQQERKPAGSPGYAHRQHVCRCNVKSGFPAEGLIGKENGLAG
jgi:hypothetical protein